MVLLLDALRTGAGCCGSNWTCTSYDLLMTAPQIYLSFPGTAREALGFYAEVFGGELSLHTYKDFSRSDGPPEAIAHGVLSGMVALAGSDAAAGEKSVRFEGIMLSLLKPTESTTPAANTRA